MVNRLLRRRMVDIFAPDYRATLRLLSDYRPEYMVGSGSYFSLLAREALRVGWRPSKPVRAVMTTSETLYADMRATISEVFDAEVYDQYGSREFGRIGSECELHEGYHINTDVVYLEVLALDSDEAVRQGQRGRLVVTGLTNHAMPMIRYDIGDLASLSSHHCACGRASPLLTDLGGRLQDILWHSDHSPRPPGFVGVLLRESDHIVDFQLVQESYDLVVLRFVADRELPSEALQHIREGLRTYLGCQVAFEQVDTISRVAGKFKRIISHVRG